MMRKSILALVTVVALLAYLGLAILGWGGFAAFFSHSALIALTILLFADRCLSRKHFGARWPQAVPWSPLWRSNGVAHEQCDFSGNLP
jgi:hypothetical protein